MTSPKVCPYPREVMFDRAEMMEYLGLSQIDAVYLSKYRAGGFPSCCHVGKGRSHFYLKEKIVAWKESVDIQMVLAGRLEKIRKKGAKLNALKERESFNTLAIRFITAKPIEYQKPKSTVRRNRWIRTIENHGDEGRPRQLDPWTIREA